MNETDIQAAVDDMLAELMQEGIAGSGDYIDADTGLLMCGKCPHKKADGCKADGAYHEAVLFMQMQIGGIGERRTETER